MKKFRVGQKIPLVENLLIIEGITRSGKFLLANILNGFEDIEPAQYSGLLEQIPFLATAGFIEKNTAKELIRCEVDMRAYEMLIGRNLNQRLSDKSSIFNNPNYQKFLDRTKGPEGQDILKDFRKNKIYSPFILHESMAQITIYFEIFPKAKCITIQRNPLDLAYSWYRRGLGKRWGIDPLLFQITFTKGRTGKVFPWFAVGWEDLYLKLEEADRAILSIKSLVEIARDNYHNLSTDIKKRILVVSFDEIIADPEREITKISGFLREKPLPEMRQILKREKLPTENQKDKRKEILREIENVAKKEYLKKLLNLPANYLN